jgi:hypothetical protein
MWQSSWGLKQGDSPGKASLSESILPRKTSVERDRIYDDGWTGDGGVDVLSRKIEL